MCVAVPDGDSAFVEALGAAPVFAVVWPVAASAFLAGDDVLDEPSAAAPLPVAVAGVGVRLLVEPPAAVVVDPVAVALVLELPVPALRVGVTPVVLVLAGELGPVTVAVFFGPAAGVAAPSAAVLFPSATVATAAGAGASAGELVGDA